MAEPTEAAKKLLAQCAKDYIGQDVVTPYAAADKKTAQVMGKLAAQRAANRLWGKPDEPAS